MAYRETGSSKPACHRHASSPADATCARCLQPICEICVLYEGAQPHCPPCSLKRRRARTAIKAAVAAAGLVAAGAVAVSLGFVVTREKPFNYGTRAAEVKSLEEALEKEPCDRLKMKKLADTMLRAGNYRGVLVRSEAFFARCGDYPRLRWITYSAHEHLSEWDAAIADATRLIKDRPEDQDFWWWRGMTWEKKGELDKAAADFREAMRLMPHAEYIPFNLASVLEKLNKPCEAMEPVLKYLEHHPQHAESATITERLARLDAACQGRATLPSRAAP